jgi:hypothetical protein
LAPIIEPFEGNHQVKFELTDVPPLPRIWFIHFNENGIIQVQRDRFLHNWRKVRPNDEYPRYHKVIEMFQNRFSVFESFLQEHNLDKIVPLQYEITYINHISQGQGWETISEIGKIFPDFTFKSHHGRFLPQPEDINWRTSFVLPNRAGRLHVIIRQAIEKESNLPILLLELTVRGIGSDRTPEGMWDWFNIARKWIVNGFADLTDEEVQKRIWKREN